MTRFRHDLKTNEITDETTGNAVIKVLTSEQAFVVLLLELLNNNTFYGRTSRQGRPPSQQLKRKVSQKLRQDKLETKKRKTRKTK